MNFVELITAKPVLIGTHLGAAIIGIDAFLWLLGEVLSSSGSPTRRARTALIGLFGYLISWIAGGYYYVHYYGSLVKPVIKASSAAWVHQISMETKEHIFLFTLPLAITILCLSYLDENQLKALKLKQPFTILIATVAGLGLFIGLLGFTVSAAVRWGSLP